jgi:hypothetical protein
MQKRGRTSPGNTSPGNTSPGNMQKRGRTSPGNTSPGNTSPGNTSPGNMYPGNTYRLFNPPPQQSQQLQQLLSGNGKYYTLPGNRHHFVCGGCNAGDSVRNTAAKTSIRNSTTPVRYIFVAGGHGKMVDNGVDLPTEARYAIPACTTIFPNYLGEKAISGASKHTIVPDLVKLIKKQQQKQGYFMQGDFLDILKDEDVQKIDGCPAITVHRHHGPVDLMHNLFMFGTGGIHSEDFLNAYNPSCLYMVDMTTGHYRDLAPTEFTDNIAGWRANVGAAVADWDAANPLDTSTRAEKMKKINDANTATPNPTFTPKPPDVHYVKHNNSRVTLGDVTDVIKAKMTDLNVSPDECLLYVIACRRCETNCNGVVRVSSSSGGASKTKKRRRRRTRTARYRSRQMRTRTRTKRTKRK